MGRCAVVAAMLFLGVLLFHVQASHYIKLETTFGDIVLELDSTKAPGTVANFIGYVRTSFYNGTIFHRVIKDFMIQGGGLTENMTQKQTGPAIRNEAFNGLSNVRGTIAMARTSAPHSATSQFYINTVNNTRLNFRDSSTNDGWGYCVFGKVVEGMSVVDSIEKVSTRTVGNYQNVPVTPILITNASLLPTGMTTDAAAEKKQVVTFCNRAGGLVAFVRIDEKATFDLYTPKGSRVFSCTLTGAGRNEVTVQNLSPGVYVYRINAGRKLIGCGSVIR